MLEVATPVVVYVGPRGAEAASAGFFLLMAADVAAMAPGTNTGAAHPVGGQGEDIEGVMGEKVEQNAAAKIRSLAARNGRNQELAEEAVVDSRSFSADEALELGLVDLVASDRSDLLRQLDGREVRKSEERTVTLALGAAPSVREVSMSPLQRLRSILVHPNVAYILMGLGWLGLVVELYNPGSIVPGVVGVICLILAFYGLSVLPVNYAGVALIGLAVVLFIAELKVPSFGFLTASGIASLVLGSLLLFKSADPAIRVSLQLIVTLTLVTGVVVVGLLSLAVRAQRRRVSTGQEGLLLEKGRARSAIDPEGKVTIHGEIWNAVADEPVAAGETVEVVGVEGLTLRVRPLRTS
jgi:membrane-bound serine protease (ClpP class)